MTDLQTRLRDVELVEPPDLWAEIAAREPREVLADSRRRVALAVAAAVVAIGVAIPLAALTIGRDGRAGGVGPAGHRTITVGVPSEAMAPTLPMGRDVVVDLDAYAATPPQRGDIVAFRVDEAPGVMFIKRVIGLPGETLAQRDGAIYVDGRKLDEPYVGDPDLTELGPWAVQPGHLFVAGDNRANSNDSRYAIGQVPLVALIGQVLLGVQPSEEATPPPAGVGAGPHVPFVPATYGESDRTVLPVTFPDGTSAELIYPRELRLAEMGVQPDVALLVLSDPAARYPIQFFHGAPDPALFGSSDGRRVCAPGAPQGCAELRSAGTGQAAEQLLVYQVGDPSWSMVLPIPQALTADQVVATVRPRVADGFVVVEASDPLALSNEPGEGQGPELSIGDQNPDPGLVSAGDPMTMVILSPLKGGGCPPQSSPGSTYAAVCIGDVGTGLLFVHVYGEPAFVASVLHGLQARNVALGGR